MGSTLRSDRVAQCFVQSENLQVWRLHNFPRQCDHLDHLPFWLSMQWIFFFLIPIQRLSCFSLCLLSDMLPPSTPLKGLTVFLFTQLLADPTKLIFSPGWTNTISSVSLHRTCASGTSNPGGLLVTSNKGLKHPFKFYTSEAEMSLGITLTVKFSE